MSAFKYFTMIECPCRRVARKESEELVPDCSVGVKVVVKTCSMHGNLVSDRSMLMVT